MVGTTGRKWLVRVVRVVHRIGNPVELFGNGDPWYGLRVCMDEIVNHERRCVRK